MKVPDCIDIRVCILIYTQKELQRPAIARRDAYEAVNQDLQPMHLTRSSIVTGPRNGTDSRQPPLPSASVHAKMGDWSPMMVCMSLN